MRTIMIAAIAAGADAVVAVRAGGGTGSGSTGLRPADSTNEGVTS